MRDKLAKILFAGFLSLIFLSVSPHQVKPVYADTSHCGTINSNETWSSSGNVHVIDCNVTVAVGVTLTISEGTIIKFKPGTRLLIDGALKVLGTSGNPVYFTSYADDTVGGDTNGNGASTGSRGNWSDIRFRDTSDDATSLIDHAIIRYAGDNYLYNRSGGITLLDASPVIQNTTLSHNEYCAIYANLHAFPALNGNTIEYNERNALCLSGGTLDIDAVWDVTDTSYFLLESVTVAINQTLTVDPDVIVKFGQGKRLAVNGALKVLGAAGQPVYFTSYADDTIGGDSNGNGASTGSRGNWSDIRFTDTSDDVNSLIDYAVIRYGGDNYLYNRSGGITLLDASPVIQNTTLSHNEYCAIYANLHAFPALNGNTIEYNERNALCLSGGTLDIDAVWDVTDTSYFLLESVTVAINQTLTVDPDVIVKFGQGKRLAVNGALKALGTSGNPIYFTSYADDTIGGDSNGNGASTGSRGNWSDIRFTDTSDDVTSLIDHAIIRYGGDNYLYNRSGGITLLDASPAIQNTLISDNEYCAIYANLHAFPALNNNLLEDNERNGLCLSGGTLDIDAAWDVTDTSYFLLDPVTVAVNQTLTVDSGVIVKFGQGKRLAVNGALRALGTSESPVYFTSYADDTVGGDTNGNGASTGSPGNWSDIRFTDTSDDVASLIDYAIIRYAGDNYLYNRSGGITLLEASPAIRNTQIYQNEYAGILTNESQPGLICNDIYSNTNHGIFNQTTGTTVFAKDHWWGTSSGPYHETLNTAGAGNTVTDGVDFIPWRNQPCTSTLPPEPDQSKVFLPIAIRD